MVHMSSHSSTNIRDELNKIGYPENDKWFQLENQSFLDGRSQTRHLHSERTCVSYVCHELVSVAVGWHGHDQTSLAILSPIECKVCD